MVRAIQILFAGLALSLLLLIAPAPVAHAQGCPSGAFSSGVLPAETRVRVLAVSESDAYFPQRAEIVGKTGTVDRMDPTGSSGQCWYGGQFNGDDGSSYYFYQVALEVIAGGGGCPSGSYTGTEVYSGTRVRILAVSPEDAYYGTRHSIEGKVGRVEGTWSKMGEPCWFAGQFYADDGSSNYFYQAAVEILSGGEVADSCPPTASTASLTEGTRVKVLAIHSEDAYHSDAARIIGIQGKVSGDLHSNGGCWMGGGFTADDGTYYYFYKAAVEVIAYTPSTPCPPGANTAPLSEGTRVKIVALHPDDAYHSDAARIIGTVGVVSGGLTSSDGCWMGGGFTADDGNYYYFYKAAVTVLGGGSAPTPTGERFMGSMVSTGQRFRIVALHPDDAYYPDRVNILGKHCHANAQMNNQGPGWYSGEVGCDDGTDYYFFKVGIVLE